ncbi:MAG: YdgA family protein [Proteobacteria bacterium]|nr:YdgA family protein [Pseudomonadota bacterium]
MAGIAIESRIQQSEQQTLAQTPYLALLQRECHRGVYRSTEIATYGFLDPLPAAVSAAAGTALPSSATFTVVSHIQHGPLPAPAARSAMPARWRRRSRAEWAPACGRGPTRRWW